MSWDPNVQNNNPYTANGYEKTKLRKVVLVVTSVLLAIVLIIGIVHVSQPESQQDKYIQSATAAAKKQTPDAEVTGSVKVAGGFAVASVRDPSAEGQASSGNETIFKVNNDGSMVQIASGSSFSPLALLELSIPFATQAKLAGSTVVNVRESLANQCGYSNAAPGFIGFNGSFSPSGWQIDSATLSSLERKLSNAINNLNSANPVICVNATQENSNFTTDKTTYISTFTLQAQFITNNGTFATHTLTFAIGPNYYRGYTLDGNDI